MKYVIAGIVVLTALCVLWLVIAPGPAVLPPQPAPVSSPNSSSAEIRPAGPAPVVPKKMETPPEEDDLRARPNRSRLKLELYRKELERRDALHRAREFEGGVGMSYDYELRRMGLKLHSDGKLFRIDTDGVPVEVPYSYLDDLQHDRKPYSGNEH